MKKILLIAGTLMVLAGCGGGGDAPAAADERRVPASATASPMAYADYVGSRPVEDMLEPLVVQGVVPPTSDDEEPAPLR